MANLEHVEIVKRGTKSVNKWREDNPDVELDLSDIELRALELDSAFLSPANLKSLKLFDSNLSKTTLIGCDFRLSRLRNVNLQSAILNDADFSDAELALVNMNHAVADKITLNNAKMYRVDLTKAWIVNSKMLATRLEECTLLLTAILGSKVNSNTTFTNSTDISDCAIDRHTIACLGEQRGGLTDGNLSEMDIHDDVAELRLAFSGIWGTIHFIAILAFMLPYLWFLFEHGIEARFSDNPENSISLLEAFLRYIWNGGVDWRAGWNLSLISFGTFIFFLLYNSLRLSLLYKVKKLETKQEVSGVPAFFSFFSEPIWFVIFSITQKWGFIFYLFCVCVNIYHFMQMRIPV